MSNFSYGWHVVDSNYYKSVGQKENWRSKSPIQFLTTVCDSKCYTWNPKKNAIVIASYYDVIGPHSNDIQYKEWQLNVPIAFEVNILTVQNAIGIYCLLWGPKGAGLVHLPTAEHSNGNAKAPCVLLGEKFHVECSRLKLIQAKLLLDDKKKIVVVLYNDRYLRIYDANSGDYLVQLCATTENHPTLETESYDHANLIPVDFDFGPCLPKSQFSTIFVLQASGGVQPFFVRVLEKSNRCIVEVHDVMENRNGMPNTSSGELAMSILCTSRFPMVVIIATNTGTIYHSVLLPLVDFQNEYDPFNPVGNKLACESDTLEDDEPYNVENMILRGETALIVHERLTIEPPGKNVLSFVKLIQDPRFDQRYACLHDNGSQFINARFINEIVNFMDDSSVMDAEFSATTVRNLIRWKFGEGITALKCLLGTCISDGMPQTLLFVLHDGSQTLTFGLPDVVDSFHIQKKNEPEVNQLCTFNPAKHVDGYDDPLEFCKSVFQKSKIPPLIFGDNVFKGKDIRKMMLSSTTTAVDHIKNLNDASIHLTLFIRTFEIRTKNIAIPIHALLANKGYLTPKAEILAENYEELSETDELFQRRIENVLSHLCQASPMLTDKERKWIKIFETIENEMIDLKTLIDGLKGKLAQRDSSCTRLEESRLTVAQLQPIKVEVASQHEVLSHLMEDVRNAMMCANWQMEVLNNVSLNI